MFERFTRQARDVVGTAARQARQRGDRQLGCEHLLLAVVGSSTPVAEVLSGHGITAAAIDHALSRPPDPWPFHDLDEQALAAIGIDLDRIRESLADSLGSAIPPRPGDREAEVRRRPGPFRRERHSRPLGLPFTRQAKACLERSLREAVAAHDRQLGVEHLALALAEANSPVVRAVLAEAGVSSGVLREAVRRRYRLAG